MKLMALLCRESRCRICEGRLFARDGSARERIFATSGVWLPPGDELHRYCDAAMHWTCMATWVHRRRFIASYVHMRASLEAENPWWARAYSDAHVFVDVSFPELERAHVTLFDTATSFHIGTDEWDAWVDAVDGMADLHPLEILALDTARRGLRANVPTRDKLISCIDPERAAAKKAWHDAERRAAEDAEAYKIALDEMAEAAARDGLECPQCKRVSRDYKRGWKGRAMPYLACRRCGFRIGPRGPVLK